MTINRWTGVEGKFRKTIKTLESKIDHLRQLCEAQAYTQLNKTQAELVQQLAELTTKQKHVTLPCLSLPFQANSTFFGYYERSLHIRETPCAPDSNLLATNYSAVRFALVVLYRGREAVQIIQKAFDVFKNKTDAEKLAGYNVDRYYRNMTRVRFYMGRLDESEQDVEDSIRWQNRVYGKGSHYHGD